MQFSMSNPFANSEITAADRAAKVLSAWVAEDEAVFRQELGDTLNFCTAGANGYEEEQLELLEAVIVPLRQRPVSTDNASLVQLCVNLLVHLAGPSWTPRGCAPSDISC